MNERMRETLVLCD